MNNIISPPLLTIAIPTFNRVDCLRLLIDSLMQQLEGTEALGVKVQILISNNASTDGTGSYLDGLSNIPGIKVWNQELNIGGDANIAASCELSQGKYVWIIGDDDLAMPGTVLAVLDLLETQKPDLVYLSPQWVSGDLGEFLQTRPQSLAVESIDSMGLAIRASINVTFISSWIMNMDSYKKKNSPNVKRFVGTSLCQLEWVLTLLSQEGNFLITKDNWILARAGNSGGYSVFEVFSENFNFIINSMLASHIKLKIFLKLCMLRCFIPILIWGVRKNEIGKFAEFDALKIEKLLEVEYKQYRFFRWLLVPMIKSPIEIARFFWIGTRIYSRVWLFFMKKNTFFFK